MDAKLDSILGAHPGATKPTGTSTSTNDNSTATGTGTGTSESHVGDPIKDLSSLEQRSLYPQRFLYTEVVRAHLGERAAALINLLLSLGRLSIRDIFQRFNNSSSAEMVWDIADVKSTLVSLIQLRCIRYLEETSYTGKRTTYYYYNEDGILLLLYSGLIIEEINTRFPPKEKNNNKGEEEEEVVLSAAQIVQNVLSLGSITVNDYLQSALPSSSSSSSNTEHEILDIFVRLCETEFLTPLTRLHYTPLPDLWNLIYEREYKLVPVSSTTSDLKRRNEAKGRAKLEFLRFMNASHDLSNVVSVDQRTSLKTVVRTIPLTFNLERFLKTRRSKQLIQFAKYRVGPATTAVYKAALRLTEQKSPEVQYPLASVGLIQDIDEAKGIKEEIERLEEKTPGVVFNAIDISQHLPSYVDLRGYLTSTKGKEKKGTTNVHQQQRQKQNKRPHGQVQEGQPVKKIKTEDGVAIPVEDQKVDESLLKLESQISLDLDQGSNNMGDEDYKDNNEEEEEDGDDDEEEDDDDDPHSVALINKHLRILATNNIPFLKETRPGVFFVPYSALIPILRSFIYDYLLVSTLGQSSMRIRRCICANSLVSEKVINSVALLKEKDIRTTIASLVKHGVIEIQEVPRTNDRAAARAVFLFRSREKHAYNTMKQNLEWNIARLYNKKEKLREENATLLTKSNREDVKGKEAELLLPSELNQLKMVNERELSAFYRGSRLISLWEVFKFSMI